MDKHIGMQHPVGTYDLLYKQNIKCLCRDPAAVSAYKVPHYRKKVFDIGQRFNKERSRFILILSGNYQ